MPYVNVHKARGTRKGDVMLERALHYPIDVLDPNHTHTIVDDSDTQGPSGCTVPRHGNQYIQFHLQ